MATDKFEGGLETLGALEDATDPYQAVGCWWARAILRSNFDNGSDDEFSNRAEELAMLISIRKRDAVMARIGGFAQALAHLAREKDLGVIGVDYHPCRVLVEAAELSELPVAGMSTFPWKTQTYIREGIVSASSGYGAAVKQVWPPIPQELAE